MGFFNFFSKEKKETLDKVSHSSYKGAIYSADPVKIACKCVSCKAEHIEYRNDL